VINGMVIAMLTVESIADIRTKSVSLFRLLVFMVAAVVFNIVMKYQSLWSLAGGVAIGIVLLIYARLSGEGIGYGDCAVFIVLGTFIGFSENIRLLFFSMMVAAVAGVVYMLAGKKSMRARVPFLPCILVTFIGMKIVEVFV